MKEYSEQRRERLNDAIFDYISDESATAKDLVRDIIKEVRSAHIYFSDYERKCASILDLIETSDDEEMIFDYDLLTPKKQREPAFITDAKVQAKSPYNDGWTQKAYEEIVKDWQNANSVRITGNVTDADEKDWEDFWEGISEDMTNNMSYQGNKMYDC
tara:strand:+ start:415 stop:888 length:474 start_codon:yes stop_codon:yes gene_type:complete